MENELKKLLDRMNELTQELQEVQKQIREICMQEDILETLKRRSEFSQEENTKVSIEQSQKIESQVVQIEALNPQVFEFLDLYTMEERLDYLKHTIDWKSITEKDLDVMAVSVDIVLKENEISDKIDDLIHCVEQLAQWEINGKRR